MKSIKQYKTLTPVSFSTELTLHPIPKAFKIIRKMSHVTFSYPLVKAFNEKSSVTC